MQISTSTSTSPPSEVAGRAVTYRLFRDADLPGVLRLWEEHSGWGGLTPEKWRKWYVETPHGECLVVVGVDDAGDVVAQKVFVPSVVRVAGREVRAIRISAPILAKRFRHLSIRDRRHPIIALWEVAAAAAVAGGYGVVYSLPDHAWLPFFRWVGRIDNPIMKFAQIELGCVALPLGALPAAAAEAAAGVDVAPAGFVDGYTALWKTACASFPIECAVARHPAWLHYKNRGHLALEVRRRTDRLLLGYAAVKKRSGLVEDVLARTPDDAPTVLAAVAVRLAADRVEASPDERMDVLKVMDTPALRPALEMLGFEPIDYKFAFVCNTLDPTLSPVAIAPKSWYITPGD